MTYKKFWPTILYPCQNLLSHGVSFVPVPMFSRYEKGIYHISYRKLTWMLSALLLSSQSLWSAIEKKPLYKSEWCGWLLAYLSKNCLSNTINQNPKDVFKLTHINKIHRLIDERLQMSRLSTSMNNIPSVAYINLNEHMGRIDLFHDSLQVLIQEQLSCDEIENKSVFVIENFNTDLHGDLEDTFMLDNDTNYELRCICSTYHKNNNRTTFSGEIYARHGKTHNSWWYQKRNDYIRHQLDDNNLCLDNHLSSEQSYVLLYSLVDDIDIESMRDEFLKHLGGQNKAKCAEHKLCLV